MRKFLAYMMLTIFSFQILPVKEVGRLLSKSQLTEEVHEDYDGIGVKFEEDYLPKEPSQEASYLAQQLNFESRINVAIHLTSLIRHQHFPDIFAPPPNTPLV